MTKKRRPKKSKTYPYMKILSLLLGLFLLIGGLGTYFFLQALALPDLEALKNYRPLESTVVLDRYERVLGRFFSERRTVIKLETIPKIVPLAFVAAEDGDFYFHKRVDLFSLARAFLQEIKRLAFWIFFNRRGHIMCSSITRNFVISEYRK